MLNPWDTHMNESIAFTKVYNEIARSLPSMSRIKLLLTWTSLNGLEQRFPNEGDKIRVLLRKIESKLVSKPAAEPLSIKAKPST